MTEIRYVDYSLGLEELALAFGLINREDMAQQILQATYESLTPAQVDERLTAATHSMLARGLTSLSKNNTPQLDSGLEKALFPLARFDYLIQLSLVLKEGQAAVTIHVQKGKTFTAHMVKLGVVHILTYGAVKDLSTYVLDVFSEIGDGATVSPISSRSITLGSLGAALSQAADRKSLILQLSGQGWDATEAENLADDLATQSIRGTLLRIDGNQSADLNQLKQQPTKSLLVLKSKKRSWLFTFGSTRDTDNGAANVVDRIGFEKAVRAFVG